MRSLRLLLPSVLLLLTSSAVAQQQILAPDGTQHDFFGLSVSISSAGNTALVGAYRDDTPAGLDAGSAEVYTRAPDGSWIHRQLLLAPDAAPFDNFGYSVALSATGRTAIVGALKGDKPGGTGIGSVYVFTRATDGTWSHQQQLVAPDGAAADLFGRAVALSSTGDIAVVGASGNDTLDGTEAGSTYVFTRASDGSWTFQQELLAPDGAPFDHFGYSVALAATGNTAIIGALGDDTPGGSNAGSAYIYVRAVDGSWGFEEQVLAPDGLSDDAFGSAVAISSAGETVVVGARQDDVVDTGSAYVFARTSDESWAFQSQLVAPDGAPGDAFGDSVAVSATGNTVVVGAWSDDTLGGVEAGSAYVFSRAFDGSWSYQEQVTAPDGAGGDQFGHAVAISSNGDRALIGAWQDDLSGGFDTGSVWVFELPGEPAAESKQKLLAPDGPPNNSFGASATIAVAIASTGDTALVGNTRSPSPFGFPVGSAHVYIRGADGIWTIQEELLAPGGDASSEFGRSVAISSTGDTAIVGARLDDTLGGQDAGSAHVFTRGPDGSWAHQEQLLAPDAAAGDAFGTSVALSSTGDSALVGAGGDDTPGGIGAGSAHVFTRAGDGSWTHQEQLFAPDGAAGDQFGSSAAIASTGDTALVGASRDDTPGGQNAGSAHAFTRDPGGSWAHQEQLFAPDGAAGDAFGASAAISSSGDTVLISAHVFTRDNLGSWAHQQRLLAPNGGVGDELGGAVALSSAGDTALVGVPQDDTPGGFQAGSAHVFARADDGSWTHQEQLLAPDGDFRDLFGSAVAISSIADTAIVGAARDGGPRLPRSGSAWIFNLIGEPIPDTDSDGILDHLDNCRITENNDQLDTDADGIGDACGDSDGDGIDDDTETANGTNPTDSDSDDDGLPDGLEDSNQDGVLDLGESDPLSPDTDGDGLCDDTRIDNDLDGIDPPASCTGSEVEAGTDPRNGDSDGDGVSDLFEINRGSNPLVYTFTVEDTADDVDSNPGDGFCSSVQAGLCTLRAAVQETNALPGIDEIALPPGTYLLDRVGADEDAAATGDLDILDNYLSFDDTLTIRGLGSGVVIDGNLTDRIFDVFDAFFEASLFLENLHLTRGLVDGSGGAVHSNGFAPIVSISNSTISENSAQSCGGIDIRGEGQLSLTDTMVRNNVATNGPGGGLCVYGSEQDLRLILDGSTLLDNQADSGGGIYLFSAQSVEITNVLIKGNEAVNDAGGIFMGSTAARINRSRIVNNTAGLDAGGLLMEFGVDLEGSEVAGNVAGREGGGLFVTRNDPFPFLVVSSILNSTISGNSAATGGGIATQGTLSLPTNFSLEHSVVTNNSAVDTGGIAVFEFGEASLLGSIVAGNSDQGTQPDCSAIGSIQSTGFNLVGVDCGIVLAAGDLVGSIASPLNPELGPLAWNGGPTRTHRLLADSLAIDRGALSCALADDQRGLPRPIDGNGDTIPACDIGAFEVQNECSDGLDDDGDGLIDFPEDPGCESAADQSERSPLYACDDGLDNDGDGVADFPMDPECVGANGISEVPEPAFGVMLVVGGLGLAAAKRRAAFTKVEWRSHSA